MKRWAGRADWGCLGVAGRGVVGGVAFFFDTGSLSVRGEEAVAFDVVLLVAGQSVESQGRAEHTGWMRANSGTSMSVFIVDGGWVLDAQ